MSLYATAFEITAVGAAGASAEPCNMGRNLIMRASSAATAEFQMYLRRTSHQILPCEAPRQFRHHVSGPNVKSVYGTRLLRHGC